MLGWMALVDQLRKTLLKSLAVPSSEPEDLAYGSDVIDDLQGERSGARGDQLLALSLGRWLALLLVSCLSCYREGSAWCSSR